MKKERNQGSKGFSRFVVDLEAYRVLLRSQKRVKGLRNSNVIIRLITK